MFIGIRIGIVGMIFCSLIGVPILLIYALGAVVMSFTAFIVTKRKTVLGSMVCFLMMVGMHYLIINFEFPPNTSIFMPVIDLFRTDSFLKILALVSIGTSGYIGIFSYPLKHPDPSSDDDQGGDHKVIKLKLSK